MILSALTPLLLLPFFSTAEAGVHRLKLHKLPRVANHRDLETAYLAEKYGVQGQTPLMGAGGAGRQLRMDKPAFNEEGEELLWTQHQQQLNKGGHGVPLSSVYFHLSQQWL